MRAIKITGLILVIVFGVYTALWYINGKANLRQVEAWMGEFAQNPYVKAMSYDSLSLKGYPFSIQVVIEKPKAIIDSRSMIMAIMMMTKSQAKPPAISELEFYSEGSMIIKAAVLGSHYELLTEGDVLSKLKADNKDFLFKTVSSHDAISIDLGFMDAMTNYRNLEQLAEYSNEELDSQISSALELAGLQDYSNWLTEVKKLQFIGKDVKVLDGLSDEVLYTIDSYDYSFSHDDIGDTAIMVGMNMDFKNMNATQAYMDKMAHMVKALGVDNYHKPSVASYQNSNMHFKVKYEGPNSKHIEQPDGTAKLDIDVGISNDIYQYANKGKIQATFKQGDFVDLDVDFDGDTEFKPGSHEHMLDMYRELLTEIDAEVKSAAKQRQTGSPLYDAATQTPLDDGAIIAFMQDNIETWAPKLEELGLIQSNLKLYAKQLGAMVINLNIKEVSFLNQLYGVAFDGNLKASMMMPIPTGEVNLNLKDYNVMLDRGKKYVDLLIKYYETQQQQAPMYLDEQLIPRFKQFITALAEDSQAKDLLIKTKFTSAEPFVLIGGKTQSEIQALFAQIFPPPPPPAPPQAPSTNLDMPDSDTINAPMEPMTPPDQSDISQPPTDNHVGDTLMESEPMSPGASDQMDASPKPMSAEDEKPLGSADGELSDEQIMQLAPEPSAMPSDSFTNPIE